MSGCHCALVSHWQAPSRGRSLLVMHRVMMSDHTLCATLLMLCFSICLVPRRPLADCWAAGLLRLRPQTPHPAPAPQVVFSVFFTVCCVTEFVQAAGSIADWSVKHDLGSRARATTNDLGAPASLIDLPVGSTQAARTQAAA